MVQRRSRLQINVFFNTDSNKILTFGIKKATPPHRNYPEVQCAVKQMAALADIG